jgi:hypothetical protein
MSFRECWLYRQLDKEDLSQSLKDEYNAELDQIAISHDVKEKKKKAVKAYKQKQLQDIKSKILKGDIDFIQFFGEEEFGSDYELLEEGGKFVIYSKTARDYQEHRRIHLSLEEAKKDLLYLYGQRLYNKYVRQGELDKIGDLIK